jgi:hypothetical protein
VSELLIKDYVLSDNSCGRWYDNFASTGEGEFGVGGWVGNRREVDT